jgi:hypothetical protein
MVYLIELDLNEFTPCFLFPKGDIDLGKEVRAQVIIPLTVIKALDPLAVDLTGEEPTAEIFSKGPSAPSEPYMTSLPKCCRARGRAVLTHAGARVGGSTSTSCTPTSSGRLSRPSSSP